MSATATVNLRIPHERQLQFLNSPAKRKIIRAGRRGGKTTGIAIYAIEKFLKGHRVLYGAPTSEQVMTFWYEIKLALQNAVDKGIFTKNETEHRIERPGTKNMVRAKTAFNADTLRGDYADIIILDEYQLMNEDAWGVVGAPMLLDNDGDAVFIYTPPSVRSKSMSKAKDKLHAAKLYKKAALDDSGRWAVFHFSSFDNPHISKDALAEIHKDMTNLAYRQEILAEDVDEIPGALWTRDILDKYRAIAYPPLARVVVAVDPAVTSNAQSDETGIVVCGVSEDDIGYVLEDATIKGTPSQWARQAIALYHKYDCDTIVAEVNNGGDMIAHTIRMEAEDEYIPVKQVRASRGKHTRAEPVSALYEHGRVSHVGIMEELEDQLCTWKPGDSSPDRLDALVWGITDLMLGVQWRVSA